MKRWKALWLRHAGLWAGRSHHESNRLERYFAEQWATENARHYSDRRCLLQVLISDPKSKVDHNLQHRPVWILTQRDATVAATVIQWLGTAIGLSFLRTVLDRDGYDIVARPDRVSQFDAERQARRLNKPAPLPGYCQLVALLEDERTPNSITLAGVTVLRKRYDPGHYPHRPYYFYLPHEPTIGRTSVQMARHLKSIEHARNVANGGGRLP